jgi:hypothetical protein
MKVDGIGPQDLYSHRLGALGRSDETEDNDDIQAVESAEVEEQAVIDEGQEDSEGTRGVIRLLQEGHFKGVADVRLRINFYDELNALEGEEIAEVLEDAISGVLESVTGAQGPTVTGSETGEAEPLDILELQEAFAAAVNEAKEEFSGSQNQSKEELFLDIRGAFDGFVESLWAMYEQAIQSSGQGGPDGGEEEGETIVTSEGGEEGTEELTVTLEGGVDGTGGEAVGENSEVTDVGVTSDVQSGFESYIANLTAAFEAAMDELARRMDEVAVLPELSGPSGNGVAYEKFLEIYNEMYDVEPSGEALNEA